MPVSKVDTVTDTLMSRIVSKEYRQTIPPQDALSRDLKVSRTVLREAISKLEAWNVLSVRPKTGTTINPPNLWTIVNVSLIKSRLLASEMVLDEISIELILGEIRETLTKAMDPVTA